MRRWIATIFCMLTIWVAQMAHAFGTEADHEALRSLMKKCTTAMNEGKFEQIRPFLDDQFTLITVDNNKFSSLNEFTTYWEQTFNGDNAILTKLEINPTADDKTYFVSDDTGVVHGTAEETYHFTDGDVRTMNTRWTALVHKDDNQWKLMKMHFSGNILDNPVLDALKAQMLNTALIGAGIGFLVGIVFMIAFRRKKS